MRGAQISGVTLHQRSRQHTFAHQHLLAINIGEDVIEQLRALSHAALDLRPLRLIDDHWQQIQ